MLSCGLTTKDILGNTSQVNYNQTMKWFHKLRQVWVVVVIMIVGLFLYTHHLDKNFMFSHDSSRDMLRALELWQKKEVTFVGPPLSFGQYTTRELYFSSLSLYIGILGLLITKFDPLGAVLPNTLLFTLSIPLFYDLIMRLTQQKKQALFATLLYAVSPLTVLHARFFWNPNLIIPLAVLFWYLWVRSKEDNKTYNLLMVFGAGLVATMMFYLHYVAIVPFLFLLLVLLATRNWKKFAVGLLGLLIGLLPLIYFEAKNEFYLTNALIHNVTQSDNLETSRRTFFIFFKAVNASVAIPLGLENGELEFTRLLNLSSRAIAIPICLAIGYVGWHLVQNNKKRKMLIILSLTPFLILLSGSGIGFYMRYVFSVYPLIIWFISEAAFMIKPYWLRAAVFVPVLFSSLSIVTAVPQTSSTFVSFPCLREAAKIIIDQKPQGKYNVTQNITGEARALALRYFLLKDTLVKPQDEFHYEGLDSLYVLAASEQDIYEANRWEFTATPDLTLVKTYPVCGLNIFFYEIKK